MSAEAGQQHPLGIYYKVWVLLFVVSAFSYAVDYNEVQGFWRWTLVLFFMVVKAGFIIAIFMHVVWERLALIWTILGPPIILLLLILFMVYEANYVQGTRVEYLGHDPNQTGVSMEEIRGY
jgi:cytochrome c oxidase subunit 4